MCLYIYAKEIGCICSTTDLVSPFVSCEEESYRRERLKWIRNVAVWYHERCLLTKAFRPQGFIRAALMTKKGNQQKINNLHSTRTIKGNKEYDIIVE